jgi:quercetin dioxygenase-like cupin family protein
VFIGEPDFTQGARETGFLLNTTRSGPHRPVDHDIAPTDRFFSQHLFLSEDVIIYLSGNAPATIGPPPHSHSVDQFFYQLEGEIELHLGREVHRLRAGDWAHIPAGVQHKHRNPHPSDRERHLEVMAPGFDMSVPFMIWAGDPAEWTAGGTVVAMPPVETWRRMPSGNLFHVLSEPSGSLEPAAPQSRRLATWFTRTSPGSALNAQWHIHDFAQFYFVMEGRLGVDVALDSFEAGPSSLVVIPAGVPHRNRVVGDEPEMHIQINVPPRAVSTQVDPWDVPVQFGPVA